MHVLETTLVALALGLLLEGLALALVARRLKRLGDGRFDPTSLVDLRKLLQAAGDKTLSERVTEIESQMASVIETARTHAHYDLYGRIAEDAVHHAEGQAAIFAKGGPQGGSTTIGGKPVKWNHNDKLDNAIDYAEQQCKVHGLNWNRVQMAQRIDAFLGREKAKFIGASVAQEKAS